MAGNIKEIPTNIRIYFSRNKESVIEKLAKVKSKLEHLYEVNDISYNKVKTNADIYKKQFGINVNSYNEFINNKYINGEFGNDIKILFNGNIEDDTNKFILITIYKYANSLKAINELEHKKDIYERIL